MKLFCKKILCSIYGGPTLKNSLFCFTLYFFFLFFSAVSDDKVETSYECVKYSGFIEMGFERCEFHPKDSDEVWWLSLNKNSAEAYNRLSRLKWLTPYSVGCYLEGYLSPERTPGYGHFSSYKREFIDVDILHIEFPESYLFIEYKGRELLPEKLMKEYLYLLSAIMLRKTSLPLNTDNFQPQILNIRKEDSDHYLLRTATTAFWFVKDQAGSWKLEKFLDKPIM